jgi:tRNA threonylcarbamoyladenosine biosynthesis protein TsaB
MRRVVSIDTSTWWGGVALLEVSGDRPTPTVVAEMGVAVRGSHVAHALVWIERLLAEVEWSRASVDGFVATRGPGSFTGVRVGLGTVRGLAIASGRPCAGVPTLDAMAHAHGPAPTDRMPILAAGRGEVFAGRYDPASSPPAVLEPAWRCASERLADRAAGAVVLIPIPGQEDPVRAWAARLRAPCARAVRGVAAAAGELAVVRGELGREGDLAPLYLRPPDAEPGPRVG